jgi:hypothetical protein
MNPFLDIQFLRRFIELLSDFAAAPDFSPQGKLYITAICSLGTDASPNDLAPDEFGCAETFDNIHKKAFGFYVAGPSVTLSTAVLYRKFLSDTAHWKSVSSPQEGDAVISPTGFGNGRIIGHVGVVGKDGQIMSNDSYSGFFKENFTLDSWKARYVGIGGFPMKYFRRI